MLPVVPVHIIELAGCTVIVGLAATVSFAAVVVALGVQVPDMRQRYR